MGPLRRLFPALALAAVLGSSGCTLCKPVVGAITGPVVLFGSGAGDLHWHGGCGCNDGYAILAVLAVASGVGAVAGLVTGIISDVQALTGEATDPCANWADPFKTNTSSND